MNDNDRVVASVTITEATGTRTFDPTDIEENVVQDLILGLVTLQETSTKFEFLEDEELVCEPGTLCYVKQVSSAMLEVLLGGPAKEEASLYLQQQFEISQGKPRVVH